jgi:hypothetical protein
MLLVGMMNFLYPKSAKETGGVREAEGLYPHAIFGFEAGFEHSSERYLGNIRLMGLWTHRLVVLDIICLLECN